MPDADIKLSLLVERMQRMAERDVANKPLPVILKMAHGRRGTFRSALALGITCRSALHALLELASQEDSAVTNVAATEATHIYRMFRDIKGIT
jgi:hypothetical protein